MRLFILSVFCLVFLGAFAQEKYPQTFISPVDIPLVLSGNFGELRSNHFHAGIDIKTQRRVGLPVYAIEDGTVTRIKIGLWGYGKALYVAHPNGYTSVYAHVQKFGPKIEEYIKKKQYQKKSYEIQEFPDYGELKVKQGDIIAFSGNTGSSGGPHLHFEIRNSLTEKPTNPLLYGYDVRDATNPTLQGLFAYPLSKEAQVNGSEEKIQLNFSRQADGTYLADKVFADGIIGLGFNGFDRQDMAANKNGIYSVKQFVNGKLYTHYDFETFSFAESRYINTLIDYAHFGKYRQRIQKCFKEASNSLSIYNTIYNEGKIDVLDGLTYKAELLLADLEGNQIKVVIPIEGKKQPIKRKKNSNYTDSYVIHNKANNFDLGGAKVYFPADTFYEDFYLRLKKDNDTVGIHNNTVPAHKNFTISFDVSKYSKEERSKLFIARLDSDLDPHFTKTYKRDANFTTRTRNLGTYTLAMDSIAPTIKPRNFKEKQWLSNYSYLSLTIKDDLSGIDTYNAYLNGKWILMEYEPKLKTIRYNFDDQIANETKCNLKVVVTDKVGNVSTFESTFFRK